MIQYVLKLSKNQIDLCLYNPDHYCKGWQSENLCDCLTPHVYALFS